MSGRAGVCIWFTGLSGSGKSTTADAVVEGLRARQREVTVLDGDVVRTHLSKGLGFGREDRDTNVRRIGYVASEVVRHGGIAVAAVVSPYRATRDEVRAMMPDGRFLEVFVDTPIEVCMQRDPKGLYEKARAGTIKNFTGIDSPYETPEKAEMIIRTVEATPEAHAQRIVSHLRDKGYLG